jgi:hypothetical protein
MCAWAAGSYSKGNSGTGGWVGDASLGIGIEAGRHDTQDNDFATGINQCLNKDGSNAATGNLNLGGFKYTNAAAATLRTDLPQVAQVQDGDFIWLGTTGGTPTAQTANASPPITAYKAGQKFRMKVGAGFSTGATPTVHTLAINGLAAKNIVNNEDGSNPTAGTFVVNAILEVVDDGTNFVITNEPTGWQTWTPTVTPSAGTASSVVTNARFRKNGKRVEVQFDLSWTQNTASAVYVRVSMPVNLDGLNQTMPALVQPAGTSLAGLVFAHSASEFRFYTYDSTTQFLTGALRAIWANGFYRSV